MESGEYEEYTSFYMLNDVMSIFLLVIFAILPLFITIFYCKKFK